MQIVSSLFLVTEFFTDQMSAVGSCIDQYIFRLAFQSAFDHGLQVFIFDFKFLKGKIIHIDNKTIISVFDLSDHIIQILELMFVNFNDTQSLVVIFIENAFDAGGFSGAGITKKQTVVCFSSLHKSFGIFDQFLLCQLITYQVIQVYVCDLGDRHDLYAIFIMCHAKCLMQSQFSHTEIFVERSHIFFKFMHIFCSCKFFAQFTDPVANTLVKYFAALRCINIICNHEKAMCTQLFFQCLKV